MFVIAALDQALATAGIAASVAGIIFTALRFRRDDATALISQQHTLYEELEQTADRLRDERDQCAVEVGELQDKLEAAQERVRRLEDRGDELEKQVDALIERLAQSLERRGTDAP